jgi:hypothetical protein
MTATHLPAECRMQLDKREAGDIVTGIGMADEPNDFRRTDLVVVILHHSTGIKVEIGHLSTVALGTDILG